METKPTYSKQEFDGYTHRFKVELDVKGDEYTHSLDIYADSGDKDECLVFLNTRKSGKVENIKIVHVSTKERDDAISDWLKDEDNLNF